jgi:hypothetical protein
VAIELESPDGKVAVSNPVAQYPESDGGDRAFNKPDRQWNVTLKHIPVAGAGDQIGGVDEDEEVVAEKKGKKKSKGKGFLGKLLGLS